MFRCEQCQQMVGPAVKSVRVAVETRVVQHPARKKAFWVKKNQRWKQVDDPGGAGVQISRELTLCQRCSRQARQR
jgi:hypothetical protein